MNEVFVRFADYLLNALTIVLGVRILMSWVSPRGHDSFSQILFQITEPILDPIRRLLPQTGMFDLAPMIAILVLNFVVRPLIAALA